MESKIPLPTDNIYKFYALFGLLLFITCIASTLYANNSTNEKIQQLVTKYTEAFPYGEPEKENALAMIIEKRLNNQVSNKVFYTNSLGVIAGISIFLMWYGFSKWHKEIQPKQDEYFELQLKKLRAEVSGSEKENN